MRRILGVDLGAHYLTWVRADESGCGREPRLRRWRPGRSQPDRARRGRAACPACCRWPSTSWRWPMRCGTCTRGRARIPQTDDELAVTHAAARYLLAPGGRRRGRRRGPGPAGRLRPHHRRRAAAGAGGAAAARRRAAAGHHPAGDRQRRGAAAARRAGRQRDRRGDGRAARRPAGAAGRGGRLRAAAARGSSRCASPCIAPDGPIRRRSRCAAAACDVLPLGRGQAADLEIELAGGVTLGGARQGKRRARHGVAAGRSA